MSFVNETISSADAQKYGIEHINTRFSSSPHNPPCWTIDRAKNVYLRCMNDHRDTSTEREMSFFWKGALFHIDLIKTASREKTANGSKACTSWEWNGLRHPRNPDDQTTLIAHGKEILADLKEALTAHAGAGLQAQHFESKTTFDF